MASKVAVSAAEKAVAEGGNLADAVDAAIRAHVQNDAGAEVTVEIGASYVRVDRLLEYFEVSP